MLKLLGSDHRGKNSAGEVKRMSCQCKTVENLAVDYI